jgi:hypothetical protein
MSETIPPPSPAVASLKNIFPSLDVGVIAAVLAQHDGNEDRAVESLRAVTDDTFVPPERLGEDTVSRSHRFIIESDCKDDRSQGKLTILPIFSLVGRTI